MPPDDLCETLVCFCGGGRLRPECLTLPTDMLSSVTALRPPAPQLDPTLARAKEVALSVATAEGHTPLLFPQMCAYRYSRPRTFVKAPTFGVTLSIALQGAQRLRLGDHELSVEASELVVVTRELELQSAVLRASPEHPSLGLNLCFEPERVARALLALAEAGGPATEETVPAFVMPCDAKIADAVERLLATLDDPLDRKLLAPLIIDEILLRLLRSDAAVAVRNAVGRAADANRILDVMQFMQKRHAEKLSVEQLARRAAMSPSHFAHRFSAVARISPMRYLREVRLDRAQAQLLDQANRVGEVALEVGFESPAHFTREYKRRFGVAPSETRSAVAGRMR